MGDLRTVISYCFEYKDGINYSPIRNISFTDRSSYMLIPVAEDTIEIPTMTMYSLSMVEEKILKKEPIDTLVVNLNNTGAYTTYKTAEASVKSAFSVSYRKARLKKLISVGNPEKTYYGTYGAIFDENFKPVVMLSWELKKIYRDDEQDPFRYKFITPILRVAPEVFIDKSNTVERFIINKLIPTTLSLTHIYPPINPGNRIFDSGSIGYDRKAKILIEDCPFVIKETDVPSISTTNEELLGTALNYIDEIIE